jgi:hypothetical protein
MVLKVVTINFTVLWDLTPCSLVKVYLLIRGMYYLHLHGVSYCTLNAEGLRFYETSVNVYQI